jgi:hypothetical protein
LLNFEIVELQNNQILRAMTKLEKENVKVRIIKLASLEGTGTPGDLAFRFEISERTVKRIVREIRQKGENIKYIRSIKSYVIGENFN